MTYISILYDISFRCFPVIYLTYMYLLCCEKIEWEFSVTWAGSQWGVVCNKRGCPRVQGNHWSRPHRSEQCHCHWQIYWTPPHSKPWNKKYQLHCNYRYEGRTHVHLYPWNLTQIHWNLVQEVSNIVQKMQNSFDG